MVRGLKKKYINKEKTLVGVFIQFATPYNNFKLMLVVK